MSPNNIYENILMPGVYIRVDKVLKKSLTHHTFLVTWFRRDDITKKLVNMDVQQDMVVPNGELKYYRLV